MLEKINARIKALLEKWVDITRQIKVAEQITKQN